MVRNKYFDWYIFVAFMLLVILGIVFIYSATYTATTDTLYYLKKHLLSITIASIFLVGAYLTPIHFWEKNAYLVFLLALFLLIVVYILPTDSTYIHRWINLGFFKFQPSEFMKFAMVLFLAKYLSKKEDILDKKEPVILAYSVLLIVMLLVAFEPHKGAALFIVFLTVILLFHTKAKLRYIFFPILAILPLFFVFFILRSNYAISRFKGLLNPDPSSKEGYQVFQSLVAFVKGGPLGEGIGMGTQKLKYLPEIHTDYIFALIGEETGIIGTLFVILLFSIIFYRGVKISLEKDNLFTKFLGIGITYILTLNAIFHMLVTLNLMPSTGFTLPFISYGGSSLIMSFTYIGILLRISKEPNNAVFAVRK